jgi:hypothetical protein
VVIEEAAGQQASFIVPGDTGEGETIRIVVEVTNGGAPPLTRYRRVVARVSAN